MVRMESTDARCCEEAAGAMGSCSLSERFLSYLNFVDSVDTLNISKSWELEHEKLVGVIKSLQMNDDLLVVEKKVNQIWELTTEGTDVVKHGSHEIQIYNQVPPEGILLSKLMTCLPNKTVCSVGFNKAMAAGWLSVDKSQKEPLVVIKNTPQHDVVQEHLNDILNDNAIQVPLPQKQDYKKRKLVQDSVITSYVVRKGSKFCIELQKEANDLTVEMMSSGSWKELQFKPYNFNALGAPLPCGHLHPLLKVRAEVRKIFLEMGFKEMPTNNYVESSFWNFDALFQPQQHPARDAHDTFFISEPATCKNFPREYMERVKKVHSDGGYGSQGYGYDWKEEEASKNLLRTHTTAASARILYKMAQEGFQPAKYFSIDKVFRNETLDATHLAEFHQVEGVIADYDLSLSSLVGTLSTFFSKLGIDKLEFKPAYNPYTEPSMEIFGYHDGLGKMIEVGNSGLFRPEMLLPMNLPENVTVIAWGLSLERPTMIKYGINNIRDLVGPKVDLKMVYDNPICRLDKGGTSQQQFIKNMDQQSELTISQSKTFSSEVKSVKDQGKIIDTTDGNENIIRNQNFVQIEHENTNGCDTFEETTLQINCGDQNSSKTDDDDKLTYNLSSSEMEHDKVMNDENDCQTKYVNSEVTTEENSSEMEHESIEVVVTAKYTSPPLSVFYFIRHLSTVCNILHIEHNHSSLDFANTGKPVTFISEPKEIKPHIAYVVRVIWKAETVTTLVVSPFGHTKILGEVNIVRFFCREYEKWPKSVPLYEKLKVSECSLVDEWLDRIHFVLTKPTKKMFSDMICDIEKILIHSKWLVGTSVSLADIVLWSAVEQRKELQTSCVLKKWFNEFVVSENLQC